VNLSETQVWVLIIALIAVTAGTKAVGPALVGGRELPGWAAGVIAMMSPALLTALVVTSVLAEGKQLAVGADTAGVGVAAVLLYLKVPLVVASVAAVAVTAGLRALG
jgi:branched-subunit amino acid transport protein